MQTHFSAEQLNDPATAEAEKILRACVHCGFCTATCPTFVLLGDELDSPRGRIYLIKDMLEKNRPADALTVKHIDRCLSCLACMTACPSGVNYMHLVDGARSHIEKTFQRPLADRMVRALLGAILPYPNRFRFALAAARLASPFDRFIRALAGPGGAWPRCCASRRRRIASPPCVAARNARRPRRRGQGAGGASRRLRAAGHEAGHQRCRDPPADEAWRRDRARQGRRMLRRAPAPSRQGSARARPGARNIDVWCAEIERTDSRPS